jgi:trimethylamine corrinoid protein
MDQIEKYADNFEDALLKVDRNSARNLLDNALKIFSPVIIADELVTKVLENIGINWQNGSIGLSQVYMAGKICEEIMDSILPHVKNKNESQNKTAIVVLEDYHVLGKRIVSSILKIGRIEATDLGAGVTVEELSKMVVEKEIKILLISTLMLPSALKIKSLRNKLQNYNIKIIVGGAPFRFDTNLWKEVGADAFGYNASDALEILKKLKNPV